ncbi:MAG: ACT domain-containing protein [Lachnospiraceae bacterium]|nr:ACT domain-containing protein [Lachnospiraceae bacterium]
MTVKQISIFVENKTGGLATITGLLADAGVNIRALSIAETSDFGILRLIVDDVFKAGNALKENGQIYSITDVLAVAGQDTPGSIAKIMAVLADAGIGMDYAYAFFAKKGELAYMIVKVEEMEKAKKVFKDSGIHVASEEEIVSL